jgi:hypothetical protein
MNRRPSNFCVIYCQTTKFKGQTIASCRFPLDINNLQCCSSRGSCNLFCHAIGSFNPLLKFHLMTFIESVKLKVNLGAMTNFH